MRRFSVVTCVCVLVGCAATEAPEPPAPDAGEVPLVLNKKRGGVVLIHSCSTTGSTESCVGVAGVSFMDWETLPDCTITRVAGCEVTRCDPLVGAFVVPLEKSAGDVTVQGTQVGDLRFAAKDPKTVVVKQRLWKPGDVLTTSATGGDLPAFESIKVVGPADIVVTAPSCARGSCGTLRREEPLTLAWTGGAATVTLMSWKTEAGSVSVQCVLPSSPAQIPPEALAVLGASADGFETSLQVQAIQSTRFVAGDYDLTFSAQGTTTNGQGSLFVTGGTPTTKWGEITVIQEGRAWANFFEWQGSTSEPCTNTQYGACKVRECGYSSGRFREAQNAGDITISGTLAPRDITLRPSFDGWYDSYFEPATLWSGGERLTFRARGDGIPAFTATLLAPSRVGTICPIGDCGTVRRAEPLVLSWGEGSAAVLNVASTRAERAVALECEFQSSPGRVEPAALARLGLTSEGYANSMFLFSRSQATVNAGGYEITVSAHAGSSGGLMNLTE